MEGQVWVWVGLLGLVVKGVRYGNGDRDGDVGSGVQQGSDAWKKLHECSSLLDRMGIVRVVLRRNALRVLDLT